MRRRDRNSPLSLLFWGALAVVLVLGFLDYRPIGLPHEEPKSRGAAPNRQVDSRIVVVVWTDEVIRSAANARFDEIDWSWLWVETLESEIGPVRVVEVEDLSEEIIQESKLILLTYSAVVHPRSSDAVHSLQRFVNYGGVLVLERPEGALRSTFSADGRGGTRTPSAITHVARFDGEGAELMTAIPLFTRFVGSTGPLDDSETLLAMDGAPVVYRLGMADGVVITVDFNYGLQLISLQQGRPTTQQLNLEPARPNIGVTVADLVASPALFEADVPYADLLEHFMVHVVLAAGQALPVYWYYPDGASGALLMTHTVRGEGELASWLARYEQSQGASSSFFFAYRSVPDELSASAYLQSGVELSVLWERGTSQRYDNRVGLGLAGLNPLYRLVDLRTHRERLEQSTLPARRVAGVRISDGLWSEHPTAVFQTIASAGLLYDSTYGPTIDELEATPAYRYGTSRPFMVHDSNGLPMGVYEVPFMADLNARAEQRENLEKRIRDSQRIFHQAIAINLDADFLTAERGLDCFDDWQYFIRRATERRHRVMSIGELIDFQRRRVAASLDWTLHERTGRDGRRSEGMILRIEVDNHGGQLWLRVPRRLGESRFRQATGHRNGDHEGTHELETRNENAFGQEITLIGLTQESRVVEVEYR